MRMKDPDFDLVDMQKLIDGFLNDIENNSSSAICADSVQINKLKKEITKLKKSVKNWKYKTAKLTGENKKLKEEIKEYEEYYDRFDILDLGDE